MSNSNNLITRYRPQSFADVIGQAAVVRSLQGVCKRKDAQVFLFCGPAGTGKTTLSRLVVKAFGIEEHGILDTNAASKTGIDDMRAIQEITQYKAFGTGGRAIILDECHRLSAQAWDSILKATEEPPAHVVWCFCTTNPSKIPKTLQTRCAKFDLKLVEDKDLGELYDYVCEQEKIVLPGEVGDLLIKEAKGSPRQLLSNLVVARTSRNKKEAASLLRSVLETDYTIELCKFILSSNGSWQKCMSLLAKLEGENPESTRRVICAYISKVLQNAKTDKEACALLAILDPFSTPYESGDKVELVLSLAKALFRE